MFKRIAALFRKADKQPTENRYEGDLVNGVRHGTGTMYYANGDIYKGKWRNGVVHGFGEFFHAKSGTRYVGEFSTSKFSGHGKMTYADGKVYDGHFLNGKRDGDGTFLYTNGTRFEGNWINDRLNGIGAMYNADGSVFRGLYCDSKAVDGFTDMKDANGNWVRVRYVRPELKDVKGCEVILLSYPYENKVQVIKAVREITGYGLALAKDITENAPQWIKKGVSLEDAVKTRKILEAAGAKVEIK